MLFQSGISITLTHLNYQARNSYLKLSMPFDVA